MTTWTSKQPFTGSEIGATSSGTTTTSDGGSLLPTTNPWSGESGGSGVSDGSGTTPGIILATDYWLRDEDGAVITDEDGNWLSLEDL